MGAHITNYSPCLYCVSFHFALPRHRGGMAGLSEPALLALLLGTMAVYFVAQWPAHARAAALDPSVPLQARLGGALLATLFAPSAAESRPATVVHMPDFP